MKVTKRWGKKEEHQGKAGYLLCGGGLRLTGFILEIKFLAIGHLVEASSSNTLKRNIFNEMKHKVSTLKM